MAGGQGTRLGHNGPKGTFIVDINPPKSIFEILVDKLKCIYKKYNVYLNWYIMTSVSNNDDTINFFEQNNYFNYPKDCITFFKQGELPLLDFEGKIALKSKSSIYMAADGNGGVFESLYRNGILNDMHKKGIEYLSIGNVDNILINQTDELLIGMMHDKDYDLASKSIPKRSADEPVGVFCKIDDKPAVIEYSDIDKNLSNLRDDNGELVYGDAHIGCNFFSLKLLDSIGNKKLPYHTAKKKNQILNFDGELVTSDVPNTYKYEAFIFDSFSMADDILIMQGKREEEFAPIKNAQGEDSPETAKKLYIDFYNKNNHD